MSTLVAYSSTEPVCSRLESSTIRIRGLEDVFGSGLGSAGRVGGKLKKSSSKKYGARLPLRFMLEGGGEAWGKVKDTAVGLEFEKEGRGQLQSGEGSFSTR